jgi:hypothetical protein
MGLLWLTLNDSLQDNELVIASSNIILILSFSDSDLIGSGGAGRSFGQNDCLNSKQ